ncbi:MAG: alpha,alpha-phosphotrehalase [Spirochaetaceae bacterium]|nr:alpha,alpha-phosphotrehalase [Spirochaetaceae bacterium]
MQLNKQSVYQIYVPSFADSNGDGLGDLAGITGKLEYIKNLGVSYIWLTPIYVSPMNDNGYDVAAYCSINPRFGTMTDFDKLIETATSLGLKVMLDMVLNHTSTQHEWFQKALAGEERYQNYYIFKDGTPGQPPTNWQSKFGGHAWHYVDKLGKWYLHLFDVTQADLNWDNPEVRAELYKVVNFWLDKGVKGLRFDVINLISKPKIFEDDTQGDGRRFYTDGPNIHSYLKELNQNTFGKYADVMTVGEMSSTSIENCLKYAGPKQDELHTVFNFHHLKLDYAGGDKWSLAPFNFMAMKQLFNQWQTQMQAGGALTALFWSNHDQPRVVSRLFSEGGNNSAYRRQSAVMLACATFLMYGVPYIYQGEEIAMPNAGFTGIDDYRDVETINYYKILRQSKSEAEALAIVAAKSRDNARTPMVWNGEKPGYGYTGGTPWLGFIKEAATINAENELNASGSVYRNFAKLLQLRQDYPALQSGTYEQLAAKHEHIYAYSRTLKEETVIVVCNFFNVKTSFNLENIGIYKLIFNNYNDATIHNTTMELKPYQAIVFIGGTL